MSCSSFSESLKLVNITPVYQKDKPTDEENARPVRELPLLSKIFERLMFDLSCNCGQDIESSTDFFLPVPSLLMKDAFPQHYTYP